MVLPAGPRLEGEREEDESPNHPKPNSEEVAPDFGARPVGRSGHALAGVEFVPLLGVEGRLGCEIGHSLRIMLAGGEIGNPARLR